MEKPIQRDIRLGTRTYIFNLIQSSASNLFILDLTNSFSLGEVGIKVASFKSDSTQKFDLPTNPFDSTQVERFLSDIKIEETTKLVSDSLQTDAERDVFALRKRWYIFIVSNESNAADLMLQVLDRELGAEPIKCVYVNGFEVDAHDFITHFSAIAEQVRSGLSTRGYSEERIVAEMRNLILGIKLSIVLTHENKETYLLKRGKDELFVKYPFLSKEKDPKLFRELKRPQAFPNEIIDSFIYLGNGRHVRSSNLGRGLWDDEELQLHPRAERDCRAP